MTSFAYTPGTRCTRAASARDAVERLRASGRSTRSARRHKGNTKREGRACRVRWGGRTPTGCGRDKRGPPACPPGRTLRPRQARPSRVLDLYDNPIISRPLSIRSFPVPLQWMKQRASQPQNQSPCPRASARSVLTGRRPRDVPAPPRRVARKGGTSRNREAVPPWMGSSDHTTSLAPSRFSATRRGGAGTSRTYTTQPRSLTGSSRARRPRGPCRAGSRPCRRSSWHTAAASRHLRS